MKLELELCVRYGKEFYYPFNKNSVLLLQLMKRESLTRKQVEECCKNGWKIKILGYSNKASDISDPEFIKTIQHQLNNIEEVS